MQRPKILFTLFILLAGSVFCAAQNYKFRTFSVEQGIAQPYIYGIAQDRRGYLWAGTAEGLCRLDGSNVTMFTGINKNADNFITVSFTDSKGNVWFGHNEGGITCYDGRNFTGIDVGKGINSPVTGITEDNNGIIWCSTQNDGLFLVTKDKQVRFYKNGFNEPVYSLAITSTNELLTGTSEGINVYTIREQDRPALIGKVEGITTKVQCFRKKRNTRSWWVGTEDEGLYLIIPETSKKGVFKAKQAAAELHIDGENIQNICEDNEQNLWLSTFGNGLYKLIHSKSDNDHTSLLQFSENNGLGSKYVRTVFQDREGNIWIGTYGAGLSMLQDNYFTFYAAGNDAVSNAVSVFTGEKDHWFGTQNGIIHIDAKSGQSENISFKGLPADKITAITGNRSMLFIGTDHSGIYQADSTGKIKRIELAPDRLSNSITAITGSEASLWIATRAGIFHINGDEVKHYTTEDGLTHNNINHIYLDKKGNLWIAAQSNHISMIANGKVINHPVTSSGGVLNIVSITEDSKGNIWFATQGNGALQFSPSTKSIHNYTVDNGLRSNYCYSISADGEGRIWIGHRTGLTRINLQENSTKPFGAADGITGECNLNAMAIDLSGNVWIGTTNGIIKYDPAKDKKNLVPPVLNITSVKFSDKEIDHNNNIELPYDVYKMKVDFTGLTFREPDRVRYQYKLEGHDVDWSEPSTAPYALYNRLADGEYTFLVRAYNSDGICNREPQRLHITVLSPIWKRWWFMLLGTFTGSYALFLIVGARERRMKAFQAHLQKMLEQRTGEVVRQKEELEKKNKDITDSITYAKRIQEAILPDTKQLNDAIPDSFVLYKPRDIVSGDFYWFEQIGNKIVIACADATGHGVPGALMSMIGSTLLKELAEQDNIQSPADLLNALDIEMFNVLKRHQDTNAQDSMDIIVCEIDLVTNLVRFASAMRPAIIFKDSEVIMFRKKQHLIGSADSHHDPFVNTDIQLSKGDSIYLFTDGYSDQFGGPKAKKLKSEKLKQIIQSIRHLPMKEQQRELERHFDQWKGDHEQVDDVLVIGLKL